MNSLPQSVVGEHPEVIEGFVVPFLKRLDDAGIIWAVAHGWYGLPKYARHDIDLLVLPKDIKAVEKAVRAVCEETGWVLYGSFRNSILWSYWILLPGEGYSYFQVDVMSEAGMRGRPFFRSRLGVAELKHRWKNEDGIWCVSYAFAAASDLLKELMANSRFEGELRIRHVEDALANERDELVALLADSTRDKALAEKIVETCRRRDYASLSAFAPAIRKGFMHYTVRDIPTLLRYIYDYFRFRFFPFLRLMVVIVGPDGCGKTTIGDGIENRFRHRPFLNIMRIHSNFSSAIRLRDIKAFLARLVGRKIEFAPEAAPGTRGIGMTKPLSPIRSMAYIAYYGMWFAFSRAQLWKWRTFSSLIIADRYYYDYFYMRGHMRSPIWFKRFVGLIVPKPNLIFYLDRPADEIFKQKPELEIDEICRQQTAIRRFLANGPCSRVIDASKGVEATIAAVNAEVEKWIATQRG